MLLVWGLAVTPLLADQGTDALKRMSIEQLLDLEVTATRSAETAGEVAAAISVITTDDIRRSGARSLPEALRLVPGIQVGRIDGARWATGARGFADRLSRAMLVLVDGRAVYSPLFAGTYWEVQDLLLEDVDRIEVIRGPGGTLWGANAVNGIINIVTKGAAQTQGALATAEAGMYGQGIGALRFGGTARDGQLAYRFYGKGGQREHQSDVNGGEADRSRLGQVGGRADWTLSSRRALTVQGDVYRQRLGEGAVRTSYTAPFTQTTIVQAPLAGGNVLARLSGPVGSRAEFKLQTYYDRTSRDEVPVGEVRDTFDVDYQQSQHLWERHRMTFGAGYRVTSGVITAVAPSAILPARRTDNLFSAFVQDDITLLPNRLRATVGTKIEHNAYSGVELQPSARLLITPAPSTSLFASVSRAVRTPSRVETDYTTTSLVNPAVPVFVRLQPNPAFQSERLVAYEAGTRVRAGTRAYLTASAFYNVLDDVLSTEFVRQYAETIPPGPPHVVIDVMFRNGLFGEAHGAELTADVRPLAWLRGTAAYSYFKTSITRDPGAIDVSQERRYEGITPRHQVQAQASADLPRNVTVDLTLRHASSLAAGPVPAYTTVSLRAGWQISPRVDVSVVGQDVNRSTHLEWPGGRPIHRSLYAKVTFRHP